jgi:hypothetical protein
LDATQALLGRYSDTTRALLGRYSMLLCKAEIEAAEQFSPLSLCSNIPRPVLSATLDSYVLSIMFLKDEDGLPLVTKIRDSAGQKGTGKWTAISALEHGVPVTLIAEAVFAR